jgi:hypothetical protein
MDRLRKLIPLLFLTTACHSVKAETIYELTGGVSQLFLDVDQKRGLQIEDDSSTADFSLGAYRSSSDSSWWGAVIEISSAIQREEQLPGSGRLIGFRFADYLKVLNDQSSFEAFAGFAQFDWKKRATGYYFGTNFRYELFGKGHGLMVETKYYQDLAYDSSEGDDIVDGFQSSFKFYYRF